MQSKKIAIFVPEYERRLLEMESQTEAFHGRRRHAREFANRAIQSAEQAHLPAGAATDLLNLALNEVEFGDSPKAREDAAAALALAADTNNKAIAAVVFARSRDSARAEKLSAELEQIETAVKPSAQQLCAALRSSCDSVAAW